MKIFQLVYSLANGGAEKFAVELSNELSKKNEVILCTVKSIEDWMLPPKKIHESVRLVVFNIQEKYALKIFFKLYAFLRKERAHAVHVHSSILMLYFSILSLLFRKTKFVQTVHNTHTPGYKKLFNFLNKMPLGKKKFVHVCISKSIYSEFCNRYPGLNFEWIDNGIYPLQKTDKVEKVAREISRLKYNKHTKVFIAIGNYSPFKNFSMLVEVFKRLHEEKQNAILLIVGEDHTPDQRQYLQVESLKGDNTFLLGSKQNIGDYLYNSDALVMSSTHEGMPLVVLEAFSAGIPVVTTPAGGIVDLVKEGENGFIAEDFTEDALYKALLRFLNTDKEQISKIGKRNIEDFYDKYSISICKQNYSKLYTSESRHV